MVDPKIRVIHSHPVWLTRTQNWMFNQVKYLPEIVENYVVCERTENLDEFALPNIRCLDSRSWLGKLRQWRIRGFKRLTQLLWLRENCRLFQPQIVHSHFGNVGYFNSWVLRSLPVKHVVTFYGLDVNMLPAQKPHWRARYHSLFRSAALFLCEGPHMAQCLVKMGCPESKVRVQHLGVEVEKIAFRPRQWKPGETLRVLIAATFREKKGIPYAIEALGRVKDELPFEITIIGDATVEPRSQTEKQQILAVIGKFKLQARVRMLGFQPQRVLMAEAYQHHIFISPSVTAANGDTEGGAPVSIIEMAASGIPVVSTRHCDIPNVIRDEETGFLAKERDVNGLVNGLRQFMLHPENWNEILKKGRKHIEENFDVRKQGCRLGRRYEELI